MIAAVVLAAGSSSRMGRQKLLLEWRGETVVRRATREALASRADLVIVVTGADAGAVRAALDGLPVTFVHNPEHARGMSTSLRAGVRAASDADAVLIALADQPRVGARELDALVAARERGAAIAAASFEGVLGPPAIFDRAYFRELEDVAGDAGARPVLLRHAGRVEAVPMPEAALDLDTIEDITEDR